MKNLELLQKAVSLRVEYVVSWAQKLVSFRLMNESSLVAARSDVNWVLVKRKPQREWASECVLWYSYR